MQEPLALQVYGSDLTIGAVSYKASVDLIEPRYRTFEVNQPLSLYSGPLQVESAVGMFEGHGIITLAWLPRPATSLEADVLVPAEFSETAILGETIEVRLGEGFGVARGRVTWAELQPDLLRQLHLHAAAMLTELMLGSESSVPSIYFHLANFIPLPEFVDLTIYESEAPGPRHKFRGRLRFSVDGWDIIIDSIYPFNVLERTLLQRVAADLEPEESDDAEEFGAVKRRQERLILHLLAGEGYALTHCGRLRRSSAETVEASEALELLESLGWFLSLARGSWSFPLLIVGEDQIGRQWEHLALQEIDAWNGEVSWWPRAGRGQTSDRWAKAVESAFAGFAQRWREPDAREIVKRAIIWYVSVCGSNDAGSRVVLTQAALELLAWQHLVIEQSMSPHGFDRLPAEDKIRLLLNWAGIPTMIPVQLSQLSSWAARQQDRPDGVACVTQFRNRVVHPPRSRRDPTYARMAGVQLEREQQDEAETLALWYLELALLCLMQYEGTYYNRVSKVNEFVPWVVN